MEEFNAESARKLVATVSTDELDNILKGIKREAEIGKSEFHIYNNLRESTVKELRRLGFKVVDQPGIAIQRDGLYYSIYWKA